MVRARLDGWCAALGVAEPERGFLGRWAERGSADIYVRSACRMVENLQRLATRFAREALEGGPDYFGEEHVLLAFRLHLLEAGLDASRVDETIRKLTVTNNALDPTVVEDTRAAACGPVPDATGSSDSAGDSSDTSVVLTELASGDEEVPLAFAPPPLPEVVPGEPEAQTEAGHGTLQRSARTGPGSRRRSSLKALLFTLLPLLLPRGSC